ncbi:MAG: hypothetical protein JWP37_1648 [Mucilaginibacter sp.]|nr:hypothetical protein [Mucilaginibacter sp.]
MIVSGKTEEVIEDIENIELVFRGGIGYSSKALPEHVKGLVR